MTTATRVFVTHATGDHRLIAHALDGARAGQPLAELDSIDLFDVEFVAQSPLATIAAPGGAVGWWVEGMGLVDADMASAAVSIHPPGAGKPFFIRSDLRTAVHRAAFARFQGSDIEALV